MLIDNSTRLPVYVEPLMPFKTRDKEGKDFDCHAMTMRTFDGREVLLVSKEAFDQLRREGEG